MCPSCEMADDGIVFPDQTGTSTNRPEEQPVKTPSVSICFPGARQGVLPHHRHGGASPRPQPRPLRLPPLLVAAQTPTRIQRPTSRTGEPLDVGHPWFGLRAHQGCVPWSGESELARKQEVVNSDQPGHGESRGDDDGGQGESSISDNVSLGREKSISLLIYFQRERSNAVSR